MRATTARKATMNLTQFPFSITRTLLASLTVFIGLSLIVGLDGANAAPSGKFQYADMWTGQPSGQFSTPSDVDVAPNGDVFVLDTNNHRVQVFDADGTYKYQFGSLGQSNGQFKTPLGIEVDANRVYIADSGNHRVQILTPQGQFLGKFGTPGSGNGQMQDPRDVTRVGSLLYVADSSNNRISVWEWNCCQGVNYYWVGSFGSGGSGNGAYEFNVPFGIDSTSEYDEECNDGDGGTRVRLYVADTLNSRVRQYQFGCGSPLGYLLPGYERQWSTPTWPFKVQVVDDESLNSDVVVARTVSHEVTRYSYLGVQQSSWGTQGTGNGQFRQPAGVAANQATGQIYVADSLNNRIQRFSLTGTYQTKWGISQDATGEFAGPTDVDRDSDGNIYVVDRGNDRVQKFTSSGRFLLSWGGTGTGDGQFNAPYGIHIDTSVNPNQIYVVDRLNNRIQVFGPNGNFITKWGTLGAGNGQFSAPMDLTQIGTTLYVLDGGNSRVQVFSAPGVYVTQFGSAGGGNGQFSIPKAIASQGGYILVSDNTRIQQFNFGGGFINSWAVSDSPHGMVWKNDRLAVLRTDLNRVQFYRLVGGGSPTNPVNYCGTGDDLSGPIAMTAIGDIEWDTLDYTATLLIADTGNNRVAQKHVLSGDCNPQGALGNTELIKPAFSAIAPNGDVYVTDSTNTRVVRYDSTGNVLARWGLGLGPDGFTNTVTGVGVGTDNSVYVADTGRVRRFSQTGALLNSIAISPNRDLVVGNSNQVYQLGGGTVVSVLPSNLSGVSTTFGSSGSGNGQFSNAQGLGVTSTGAILVADTGNNRIQRFSPTGTYEAQFATPAPRDVAQGADGRIYVTGTDNKIRVYASFGGSITDEWGAAGDNVGEFNAPLGVAVSPSTRVIINDVNNNRLQLYDWLPSRVQYSDEATDYAGNQVNVPNLETTTVEGGF